MIEQRHNFIYAVDERVRPFPSPNVIMRQEQTRAGACMCVKSLMFSVLLCFSLQLYAQTDQPAWRLAGLINLPDRKQAVLQMEKVNPRAPERIAILREGEAGEAWGEKIELIKIDYKKETAQAYINKILTHLDMNVRSRTNHAETEPTIIFERANFEVVLELYSELLGRTLLRHPFLFATDFTFSARAQNRRDAIHAIENALADKGIACSLDGDIFVTLVPKKIAPPIKMEHFQSNIPEAKSPHYFSCNFPNLPLDQAVDLYTGFFGCSLKRDEPFPAAGSVTIQLRTVTNLNKEEAIYALDTLFAWAGIKIVPAGQNLMKAVPVTKRK